MDKDDIKHILNTLRQGTITWKKRTDCLNKSRKKIKTGKFLNGKERTRWVYQCASCTGWFKAGELEVDHIVEVGPFYGDFNDWIARLYCSVENLQPLCTICHKKKTSGYNARLLWTRKKVDNL